jgi:hypothetical protein
MLDNYLASADTRQGMYATASGTLTQFNAIMVGLTGAALAGSEGTLKALVASGLMLHIAATFLLCWAARPVAGDQQPQHRHNAVVAAISTYQDVEDTFRHYRRGWRMTLVALTVSALAAALYVAQSFGGAELIRARLGL